MVFGGWRIDGMGSNTFRVTRKLGGVVTLEGYVEWNTDKGDWIRIGQKVEGEERREKARGKVRMRV